MKYSSIIKTIFSVLTVLILFSSACSDKFVDLSPDYSIDSENYFNSEEDYYKALVAAYDMLQSSYQNVILGEMASNNTVCGGEHATDVIGWQQVDDMIHTSVNSNLNDIWSWMFAGVQRTNYFMEFSNKINFEGKDVMIGEIRFLRAYYLFELVKWFGPVPLKVDQRFKIGDETTVPRSSVEDVFAQIETDLLAAVEVLPEDPIEQGRATIGAAQALLGKAYLYQDKFQDAADVFESLITERDYALVSDFGAIFEMEGENGPESVFEVQYTDVEGADYNCLQCSEGNVAVGFSGVRFISDPDSIPFYSKGHRFNLPTQEAVDQFESADLRKEVTILDIEAWAAYYNAFEEYSIRYEEGNEHTGYFNRKYIPRKRRAEAQMDLNLTNPNNYRAIRYADVLLMAAEAYNRGGISDEKAQEYLNRVRRRAFGSDDHDVLATGAALTDAIYQERRLELMGEGHHFFDLVRTNRAADEIDGFEKGKHELFPVPLTEIEYSNGNWKQNPNYN
jgi:tetratricopeptide (TPR) repeat protein